MNMGNMLEVLCEGDWGVCLEFVYIDFVVFVFKMVCILICWSNYVVVMVDVMFDLIFVVCVD